jgi:hypothetical protein
MVAGPAQGLGGDLIGIASDSQGKLIVANRQGTVWSVDPDAAFFATVLFSDPSDQLLDVRGLTVDGFDRALLTDQPPGVDAGRLWRLDGGMLEPLARTARGVRPAIDPLTADVFVTEQGRPSDGAGEVLRVDAFAAPPTSGHYRAAEYTTFQVGELDGALAFDAAGNFYVGAGARGRVERVERTTGERTTVAGNYWQPLALALAAGTPAGSGPLGTSLFVLDRHVVYEVAVDGLPASAPPDSQPRSADPADLRVHGESIVPGVPVPLTIESPADGGSIYVALMTFGGKSPGLPVAIFDPFDDRVVPNNVSILWNYLGIPGFSPDFVGVLDMNGLSAPGMSLFVPNDPTLLGVNAFMDLTWFVWDPLLPSTIGTIGGTAQIWFGM